MFVRSRKMLQAPKLLLLGVLFTVCDAQTLYTFGNPTAEEQSYIELINRARSNPPEEGARLAAATDPGILSAFKQFGVNLTMMQNEFNVIAVAGPLAPNEKLTTAARGHTYWMFDNSTQSHNQTNPTNTSDQRITASGYNWSTIGENIFAFADSTWYGHVGFQVDWGPGGTGGMQNPRGHRDSIHNPNFKEIGVGTLSGTNGTVGPQVVTQDFGTEFNSKLFATGVAYYDLNLNNFYDIGEGISGLKVNVNGASFFCSTAIGGGWVVPIPTTAGTRTVTFSGLGISQSSNVVVAGSTNKKVDLKLAYSPPTINSPASAVAGNVYPLAFSAVGGATGYKWNRWNMSAATAENCNSLTNVKVTTTSAYTVLSTTVKKQGTASFHLANPGSIGNQIIQLNSLYHGGAAPSMAFQSWLRTSTSSESHKVQVQVDGSTLWQDVYSQPGGTAEASFSSKKINLSSIAGKSFRIRFILVFSSGSTYANTGDNFGWFIDAINFTDTSRLVKYVSQTLPSTQGRFTSTVGTYLMSVAPIISGNPFPASTKVVTISAN
jgi:hypothetical protein